MPACCSEISLKLKVPVIINNAMIDKPIAISYEIFCEAERTAANNENLLLEAQPPIITPYTPNETTPNTYNTPTLISATCKETCLPNKNKS